VNLPDSALKASVYYCVKAVLDPGLMPFPADVMAVHEEGLRRRAEKEKVEYGPELAVQSVYEISEPVAKLLPVMGDA